MITLISLLNCNSSISSFSSRSKAKLKEFITSVRLRVRVTIWFFFSLRRMLSFIITSVNRIIERALAQIYCLQLIILFCQEKILVKLIHINSLYFNCVFFYGFILRNFCIFWNWPYDLLYIWKKNIEIFANDTFSCLNLSVTRNQQDIRPSYVWVPGHLFQRKVRDLRRELEKNCHFSKVSCFIWQVLGLA